MIEGLAVSERLPAMRAWRIASSNSASGATTSSITPIFLAFAGRRLRPVSSRSRPAWIPTSRGRRWVPPAAGNRPSWTSGRPSTVAGVSAAMRLSQAIANSRPPPRQVPSIAAITGTCSFDRRVKPACAACDKASISPADFTRPTMPISAPARNDFGLSEISTTPVTCVSLSIDSSAALKASPNSAFIVFWVAPGTLKRRMTTPSSRFSSLKISSPAGASCPV